MTRKGQNLLELLVRRETKTAAVEVVRGGDRPKYRELGGARPTVLGGTGMSNPRSAAAYWKARNGQSTQRAALGSAWTARQSRVSPGVISDMQRVQHAQRSGAAAWRAQNADLLKQFPQLARHANYFAGNPKAWSAFQAQAGLTPQPQVQTLRATQRPQATTPEVRPGTSAVQKPMTPAPQPKPQTATVPKPAVQPKPAGGIATWTPGQNLPGMNAQQTAAYNAKAQKPGQQQTGSAAGGKTCPTCGRKMAELFIKRAQVTPPQPKTPTRPEPSMAPEKMVTPKLRNADYGYNRRGNSGVDSPSYTGPVRTGPLLARDAQNPYQAGVDRMLKDEARGPAPLTNQDYAQRFKRESDAMTDAQRKAYWQKQPINQRMSDAEVQAAATGNGWGALPSTSERVLNARDRLWNKGVDAVRDSFIGDAWRGAKQLVKSVAPAHRAAQQPVQRDAKGRVIGAKPVQRRWTDDLADWMDTRGAYVRGLGSGYDPVKGMVGTGQIMLNGAAEGADYLLNRGARYLNPNNYGDSWQAEQNRRSLDNDLENQQRVYNARHEHILDKMDVGDGMGRGMYGAARLAGNVAGGEILTGGVGGGARLVGGTVRGVTRGAGNLAARGLTRVGAGRVAPTVQRAISGVGNVVTTPLRPVEGLVGSGSRPFGRGTQSLQSPTQQIITRGIPALYDSTVVPIARSATQVARAVRHPVQAMRYAAHNPVKALGTAFDAYYNLDTPATAAYDALSGDTGSAARGAGSFAWYNAMRRINPGLGGFVAGLVPDVAFGTSGDEGAEDYYPEDAE